MRTVFRAEASSLLASAGTRRRIKAAATRAEVESGACTSLLPSHYGRAVPWAVLGCFDERRRTGAHEPPHPLHQPLPAPARSEEHTSELQSRGHLVCRL